MRARPWWLLPPGRIHAGWWIVPGALVLWADHIGGPSTSFPLLYAVPVILAAWYSGKWAGIGLAAVVPLVRIGLLFWAPQQDVDLESFVPMTILRGTVVLVVGLWFARLAEFEHDLTRQVRVLEGLLPICAFCKSIRNESGKWERLESYISRRSEAEFSHGICPSCGKAHYPDMYDTEESATMH
jgi:hypothetical protein